MNNLQNYEMMGRSLKEEKNAYLQRFQDKADAAEESQSMMYEGLTAPFIEQSGMNLLKKGIRKVASAGGVDQETMDNISSIADDLKSGNWSSAANKIKAAGSKSFYTKEQQNWINDKGKLLDKLKGKVENVKDGITGKASGPDSYPELGPEKTPQQLGEDLVEKAKINNRFNNLTSEQQKNVMEKSKNLDINDYDGQNKILDDAEAGSREVSEIPKISDVANPLNDANIDFTRLPSNINLTDAGTGLNIKPPEPNIVRPTENAEVDGLPDENETVRNNLENQIANEPEDSPYLQNMKDNLKSMVDSTAAQDVRSPQQIAQEDVFGDKGLLGRLRQTLGINPKPEDIQSITDNLPSTQGLINPRDVADDSNVVKDGGYSRGLNGFKVDANSIRTAPAEPEPEPAEVAPAPTPAPAAPEPLESEGVAPSEVDRIIGQTEPEINEDQLKSRFKNLSKVGRKQVQTASQDIANKMGVQPNELPNEVKDKIISERETQEQSIQSTPQETINPEATPKPTETPAAQPSIKPEDPVIDPDADEDVIKKGLATGLETDAELGGPEDIFGDVVALGIGIGTLVGGLHAAHKNVAPPPIQQINPSYQIGFGQE